MLRAGEGECEVSGHWRHPYLYITSIAFDMLGVNILMFIVHLEVPSLERSMHNVREMRALCSETARSNSFLERSTGMLRAAHEMAMHHALCTPHCHLFPRLLMNLSNATLAHLCNISSSLPLFYCFDTCYIGQAACPPHDLRGKQQFLCNILDAVLGF